MTQALLDATDMVIILAFAGAVFALVVYVWRSEHRLPQHRSLRS